MSYYHILFLVDKLVSPEEVSAESIDLGKMTACYLCVKDIKFGLFNVALEFKEFFFMFLM